MRRLQLSATRRVGVSEFRGKRMINIREYYENNGQMKPGKKVRESPGRLGTAPLTPQRR